MKGERNRVFVCSFVSFSISQWLEDEQERKKDVSYLFGALTHDDAASLII